MLVVAIARIDKTSGRMEFIGPEEREEGAARPGWSTGGAPGVWSVRPAGTPIHPFGGSEQTKAITCDRCQVVDAIAMSQVSAS